MSSAQEDREMSASLNVEIDGSTIERVIIRRTLEHRDGLAQPQNGRRFPLNGLVGKLER